MDFGGVDVVKARPLFHSIRACILIGGKSSAFVVLEHCRVDRSYRPPIRVYHKRQYGLRCSGRIGNVFYK